MARPVTVRVALTAEAGQLPPNPASGQAARREAPGRPAGLPRQPARASTLQEVPGTVQFGVKTRLPGGELIPAGLPPLPATRTAPAVKAQETPGSHYGRADHDAGHADVHESCSSRKPAGYPRADGQRRSPPAWALPAGPPRLVPRIPSAPNLGQPG